MNELIAICQRHKRPVVLLLTTWGTYFLLLFSRAVQDKPNGFYGGHINIWGDWSIHIGMASIFAYKDPQDWFAYHPMYAGGKFTYGFLSNFISGTLMRVGFSVYSAFVIPSIIYSFLLLIGLYALFYLTLNSKKQAFVAISCFFLSSGLGFIKFLRDLLNNYSIAKLLDPDPLLKWSKIEDMGMDYSEIATYSWETGNVILGLLMPQRSFLLGLTISAWILTGLLYVLLEKEQNKRRAKVILFCTGILTGLLPITHMHSLIALVVILGPVLLVASIVREEWLDLIYYVVPASIISITLYLVFISGGIENPDFIQWLPGWTATKGVFGWVSMWLKLWGLMLPTAIFGWFTLRQKPILTKIFFLDFFLLFIIGNLILFQPVRWDNSKIFFWAYLGFCGLAAAGISWCWRKGGKTVGKVDAILLAVVLTFTGSIELVRLQRMVPIMITNRDDIQLATEIRERTDPLAVFLMEPTNSFIMTWAARSILMGFPAWVGNFGFLYQQREKDLRVMYEGGIQAEQLLDQYQISYVVIGPGELQNLNANEDYYRQTYPLAFQNRTYRVYDVRSLWN